MMCRCKASGAILLRIITLRIFETPTNADVTISDDVERLRFMRNEIVHRLKADIDLTEMNNYFSNIVHIARIFENISTTTRPSRA
jgi:hypothetical protein